MTTKGPLVNLKQGVATSADLRDGPFSARLGDATVWYVDPTSGNNNNSGLYSDEAFANLQNAIDAATAGDVVIRMPGTENPTAAITVDKTGLTIMAAVSGIAPYSGSEATFSTYPAASYTTGPTVIVENPCAIIGLEFVTRNTTSGYTDDGSDSGAALVFVGEGGSTNGGFSLIQDCRFVDWWGNDWGIEFGAGAYNVVTGCYFEGYAAGILMRGTASNNPESNIVQGNVFKDCTYGIEHKAGGTPHHFSYHQNRFIDSKGVDFNDQAADGLVSGNWYETATNAATYDITVAAAQAHGVNFSGNNYSE
jgi:hypothetical protein